MAIIGIDLGTTNSLGCVYKDGETLLIPNAEGSYMTPSAVSVLPNGAVIVGQKAKDRNIAYPDSTVLSFKRMMGSTEKIKVGEKEFLPEELSSFVVRSIVEDAEKYLGEPVTEAVISVPAYFHDKQRAATKRAGALAGVTVNRILNEPSSAALAAYKDQTEARNFLVFDFGGGTLDVSLVSCLGKIVEIRGVSGDNRLGGDDIDRAIADQFLKDISLQKEEMSHQEYAVLLKNASGCKEKLTTEESAKLEILIQDKLYEHTYTEKNLIKICDDILLRIRNVIGRALSDANMKASQVDEIIMAGGSSKMPMIQKYIRHLFHKIPDVRTDCDELIALGLGYFCGIKEQNPDLVGVQLTDVCPFSLGTGVKNPIDPMKHLMDIIIPKNSTLPCSMKHQYTNAVDMQKRLSFDILQGEEIYADDNLKLGTLEVDILPKPVNEEKVIATYTYDINGILIVEIEVPSTGEKYEKVLSENISPKELRERIRQLKEMTVNAVDLPRNQKIVEDLAQAYVQANTTQKKKIASLFYAFGDALAKGSLVEIEKMYQNIEKQLPNLQYWDPLDEVFSDVEDDWDDPWAENGEESDVFGVEEDPFGAEENAFGQEEKSGQTSGNKKTENLFDLIWGNGNGSSGGLKS